MGVFAAGSYLARGLTVHGAEGEGRRPNVLIIYTDDQPKSQFGCYGGMATPNIDRLASEGMLFNRFYVSTGLCAPSRYGLQNGRYASSSPCVLRLFPAGGPGCPVQQIGDEHNRPAETFNLPATMRAAGYATGIVGKWHQGFMGERTMFGSMDDLPLSDPGIQEGLLHNFKLAQDAAYAAGYDYAEALYHDNVQVNNFPECVRFHNQEWVTHRALRFIDANRDRPFMLVVNPTLVHYPREEPSLKADRRITAVGLVDDIPEDVQPSRQSVLERAEGLRGGHAPGVVWLDDAIGVITQRIADLGLDEDTIIMVISDNGTGGKWTCYEGGTNTGCIMRWKGHIPAGQVSDALVQNVDIAPTLFDICGAEPAAGVEMHGMSVAGHLVNGQAGPRKSAYLEFGYQRAVIAEDGMKYLAVRYPAELQRRFDAGEKLGLRGEKVDDRKAAVADEVFDLNKDKAERNNLADDPAHAAALERMKALMAEHSRVLPHTFGEFAPAG
jgi:arylsulfatase A-like enzyme